MKKYLKKIADKYNRFYIYHYKIPLLIKKLSKCNALLLVVTNYLARVANESNVYIREDEKEDSKFLKVTLKILNINLGQYDGQINNLEQITINRFSQEIADVKCNYNQVIKYLKMIKRGLQLNFDYHKLKKLINLIGPFCDQLNDKLSRLHTQSKNEISDRRANENKLNIGFSHLLKFISLVPTFALMGGYLYAWRLLSLFGVNVSSFYSINDYITASLDQLLKASAYTFIIYLSILILHVSTSRKHKLWQEKEEKFKKRFLDPFLFISIIVPFVVGIQYKVVTYVYYSVAFILISILPVIIKYTPFKQPLRLSLFLIVLTVFCFHILESSYKEYLAIKSGKGKFQNYHVHSNEKNLSIDKKDFKVITINSNYYFIFDMKSGATIILSSQKIRFTSIDFVS